MIEVKAFKCEHCAMVSMYKGHVKRHERDFCRKSPDRKACMLCLHCGTDEQYGPFCIDDRADLQAEMRNDHTDCEFFESKFARNNVR